MSSPRLPNRPRLSRDATQARTRECLVAAARQEVARRGAAASVRDIAEAAGYTQGALYAQFGSKEGLLLELLRRHMQEEAATLSALLDAAEAETAAAGACHGVNGGASRDRAIAARVEAALLERIARWAEGLDAGTDWSTIAVELQLHANRSAGTGEAHGDPVAPAADRARGFAAEYEAVYAAHRRALGSIVARLFMLVGRVPPADPVAHAAGFMALAHGMAIGRGIGADTGTAGHAEHGFTPPVSAGTTLMVFLRALLTSAPYRLDAQEDDAVQGQTPSPAQRAE